MSKTIISDLSGNIVYEQGACREINKPGETVHAEGEEIYARNLCFDYVINVDLTNADVRGLFLLNTTFAYVDFEGADFTGASLGDTVFLACRNLDKAKGLDAVNHEMPSVVDPRTLSLSRHTLPDGFLEGCGYSPEQIETLAEGAVAMRRSAETIEEAVAALLGAIDAIDVEHGEIDDTAVREEVVDAIEKGYVNQYEGYFVEGGFGMFTPQGARRVRQAVRRFVTDANRIAQSTGLTSRRERLTALVDSAGKRVGTDEYRAGDYHARYIAGLE